MSIHQLYSFFFVRFRPRRLRLLYSIFNITQETRLLDVGGNIVFWDLARRLKLPVPRVTVLNVYPCSFEPRRRFHWVVGDGRAMPFADESFDLAFCNSVIEHLHDRRRQAELASEIRRVSKRYLVQTPDPRFPVEPHYVTPFIHWLPSSLQRKLVPWISIRAAVSGWRSRDCHQLLDELRPLNSVQLKELFPDCRVESEKFLSIPKSLIAMRV